MDVDKALQKVIKTGKAVIGSNQTINAAKKGNAQLIILASNCPRHVMNEAGDKVPIFKYAKPSIDLGRACGKPYAISALAIIDPGKSDIMAVLR